MGLINWFKDKRMNELVHDFALLKKDLVILEGKINKVDTNVSSLRGMINRRVNKKPLTDDFEDDRQMDLDEVMKAFGGQLPIELQKQYGNRNTNTENRD